MKAADALLAGVPSPGQSPRKALAERYLQIEFHTGGAIRTDGLTAAGLIVVNPPWTLEREMATIAPALAEALGAEGRGRFRIGRHNP